MNRTTTILSFAIVLALVIGIVSSGAIAGAEKVEKPKPATEVLVINDNAKPIPVTGSFTSSPVCPADKVQHWYTSYVTNSLSFIELRSPTNPTMLQDVLFWVNVKVNSGDIYQIHHLAIDRLTELGYVAYNINTATSTPLSYADTWIGVSGNAQFDATHTTICASP